MVFPLIAETKLGATGGINSVDVPVQVVVEKNTKEEVKDDKKDKKKSKKKEEKSESYLKEKLLIDFTIYWTVFLRGNIFAAIHGVLLLVCYHSTYSNLLTNASFEPGMQFQFILVILTNLIATLFLGYSAMRDDRSRWVGKKVHSSTLLVKMILTCLTMRAIGSFSRHPEKLFLVSLFQLPFIIVDSVMIIFNMFL